MPEPRDAALQDGAVAAGSLLFPPPLQHGPAEDWRNAGFAAYVHWPFCASKCPYCDFNSHVARTIDPRAWADAYRREIARSAEGLSGRVLNSIYLGGGTPSLMEPAVLEAILSGLRAEFAFANDIEITLEANPGSADEARFEAYAGLGVNRLSLGVQALRDDDLRRLGRLHDVAAAHRALRLARDHFAAFSFDLIYARQGQSRGSWRDELSEALEWAPEHISVYQLTVEEGTVFAARHRAGLLKGLPDEDLAADMYQDTQDILSDAGLPGYEVSNHAVPGSESAHNLIYWRQGDWLGIGPGAHGRLTQSGVRSETVQESRPDAWLARVSAGQSPETSRSVQSGADRSLEYLMMSLRLGEGMSLERFGNLGGAISPSRLESLRALNMVEVSGGRLRATDAGRRVLNTVIAELAS